MPSGRYALIEAGGTKFLCAIADRDGGLLAQQRIATRAPEETFADVRAFFESQDPVEACGIGSFGPLNLDSASESYGRLTSTPKPGWPGVDMLGQVRSIAGVPTAIDTDVNCAAIAEARHGAGKGLERVCYVTIGTGIGVGIVDQGRTNGGAGHAEAGHSRVPIAAGDEGFAGVCPYHGTCLEGLASGTAMKARWGMPANLLDEDHPGWAYQAHYLATLCLNLSYTLRPQRIILGGGVMEKRHLFPLIHGEFARLMAGYAADEWNADPAHFICPPVLVDPSPGLRGALDIALDLTTAG